MIASRAFLELGVGDIPTLDVLQTMDAPTSNVPTTETISNTDKRAPFEAGACHAYRGRSTAYYSDWLGKARSGFDSAIELFLNLFLRFSEQCLFSFYQKVLLVMKLLNVCVG